MAKAMGAAPFAQQTARSGLERNEVFLGCGEITGPTAPVDAGMIRETRSDVKD